MVKKGVKRGGVESENRVENGRMSTKNEQFNAFLNERTQINEGKNKVEKVVPNCNYHKKSYRKIR